MGEEKIILSDLIRDSFTYDLEQIKVHRQQIDEIENKIQENHRLIRKVSLKENIDNLKEILRMQEDLKGNGLDLNVYQNAMNLYLFKINGSENDIRCDSTRMLKECIHAMMIGMEMKK